MPHGPARARRQRPLQVHRCNPRSFSTQSFARTFVCSFLHNLWTDKKRFEPLSDSTFVLTSREHADKHIQQSLAYRHPVYFGNPALTQFGFKVSFYRPDVVRHTLGYNPVEAQSAMDPEVAKVRYVIAGRVELSSRAAGSHNFRNICVVHGWGCNFERRTSYDYQHIHAKTRGNDHLFRQELTTQMVRRPNCRHALVSCLCYP